MGFIATMSAFSESIGILLVLVDVSRNIVLQSKMEGFMEHIEAIINKCIYYNEKTLMGLVHRNSSHLKSMSDAHILQASVCFVNFM